MCRNDALTFSPSQSIRHLPEALLKPSARVVAVSFLVVLSFDAFSQRVVTMSFPSTGPPSRSTCYLKALLNAFARVVSCVFLSCVVLWCLFLKGRYNVLSSHRSSFPKHLLTLSLVEGFRYSGKLCRS